jgi:Transcriptional activator, adenine-specific DNA methyltransferase
MKKYSIIYADPPWAYRTYSKKGQGRSAESHYPTMCIEDIKALPVGELAAKDCALFSGSRSRASVKHSKC